MDHYWNHNRSNLLNISFLIPYVCVGTKQTNHSGLVIPLLISDNSCSPLECQPPPFAEKYFWNINYDDQHNDRIVVVYSLVATMTPSRMRTPLRTWIKRTGSSSSAMASTPLKTGSE